MHRIIRVGEVYAVKAQDRDGYYRTVMLKKIDFHHAYQALISNPVYGEVPDGMEVVDQEQVFKRIRDLNAAVTETSLDAFPYFKVEGDMITFREFRKESKFAIENLILEKKGFGDVAKKRRKRNTVTCHQVRK